MSNGYAGLPDGCTPEMVEEAANLFPSAADENEWLAGIECRAYEDMEEHKPEWLEFLGDRDDTMHLLSLLMLTHPTGDEVHTRDRMLRFVREDYVKYCEEYES